MMYRITLLIMILATFGITSCANIQKKTEFPIEVRDSFLKVEKFIQAEICQDTTCILDQVIGTGSGSVVGAGKFGSLVLTAAHVCETNRYDGNPLVRRVMVKLEVVDLELKRYDASIILLDRELDTCMLSVVGMKKKPLSIRMGSYEPGTKVYNVAAPVGIMNYNLVPLLDGYFLGNEGKRALYSVPAAGGSSGSPIVDARGNLVGMVHSVNIRFPMITVSPTLVDLRKFIFEGIRKHQLSLHKKNISGQN